MKRIISSIAFFTAFILMAVVAPIETWAAWSNDPAVNTAISVVVGDQTNPQIVTDGAGGAIITWIDERNGADTDVYAQRIGADGNVKWTANGVAISAVVHNQIYPQIVSDGSGGAIITWQDERNPGNNNIYAQRIDANGTPQWAENGVVISAANGMQLEPKILSDGSGGAIITWMDARNVAITGQDIYAQRIDAGGNVRWTANGGNGVPVCAAPNDQVNPQIVTDGAGGAIITWQDQRSGRYDIYAQRIDADGIVKWTTDGVAISTEAGDQTNPQIVSDEAGGAIITWTDARNGADTDIYAQRIGADGIVKWITNGVAIFTGPGDQTNSQIVTDGAGGGIITWIDTLSPNSYKVNAQRIDKDGTKWTNYLAIGSIAHGGPSANLQQITSDGSGSAIIAWQHYNSNNDSDIYAQKIAADRTVQWGENGVAISTAAGDQLSPQLVTDGAGGAIITWQDSRNGNADIYAQGIGADGIVMTNLTSPPLYAAFGAAGVWVWDGITWTQINAGNPTAMVASGALLYANFGAAGVWVWNGITWNQINAGNPTSMVAAGAPLYANFGAAGVWVWNGITWYQINAGNPTSMTASGALLYANFGSAGVWVWNGITWNQINGGNPTGMVASGALLYANFGAAGIWVWNGTTWNQINAGNPTAMVGF